MECNKAKCESCNSQELLMCGICHDHFQKPVTTQCGHTFCKACLEVSVQYDSRCPSCRCEIREFPKLNVVLHQLQSILAQNHKSSNTREEKRDSEDEVESFSSGTVISVLCEDDVYYLATIQSYNQVWQTYVVRFDFDSTEKTVPRENVKLIGDAILTGKKIISHASPESEPEEELDLSRESSSSPESEFEYQYHLPQFLREEAEVHQTNPRSIEEIVTEKIDGGSNCISLLHVACVAGDLAFLKNCCEDSTVDINSLNISGYTAAQCALILGQHDGHVECLKYMDRLGANIEVPDLSFLGSSFQWPERSLLWLSNRHESPFEVEEQVYAQYGEEWYPACIKEINEDSANVIYFGYEDYGVYNLPFSELRNYFDVGDIVEAPCHTSNSIGVSMLEAKVVKVDRCTADIIYIKYQHDPYPYKVQLHKISASKRRVRSEHAL